MWERYEDPECEYQKKTLKSVNRHNSFSTIIIYNRKFIGLCEDFFQQPTPRKVAYGNS